MVETKYQNGTTATNRIAACFAAFVAAASLSCVALTGPAYAAPYEAGSLSVQADESDADASANVQLVSANGRTTTNYGTLSAALAKAKTGATVKLMADLDESVSIDKDVIADGVTSITIDLNGHTVTSGGKNPTITVASKSCAVAIVDTSADKSGVVEYTVGGGKVPALKVNYGAQAAVSGIAIEGIDQGLYNAGATVLDGVIVKGVQGIYNLGDVTLSDVKVEGGSYGVWNDKLNTLTGHVVLESGTVFGEKAGIYNRYGSIEVKGGTVSGTSHGLHNGSDDTASSTLDAVATVSGGTVVDAYNNNGATLNVVGGSVEAAKRDAGYTSIYDTFALTANGGTVNISGGVVENANASAGSGDHSAYAINCTNDDKGASVNVINVTGSGRVECPNGYDVVLNEKSTLNVADQATFVCRIDVEPVIASSGDQVVCPEGKELKLVAHDDPAGTDTHMLGDAEVEQVIDVEIVAHNGAIAADPISGVEGTEVTLTPAPAGDATADEDDDTVLYKVTLNGAALEAAEDGTYAFAMPADAAKVEAYYYPKAFDLALAHAVEVAAKAGLSDAAVTWDDLKEAAAWIDKAAAFLADVGYDFGDADTKAACEAKLAAARAELAKVESLDMSGKAVDDVDACMAALANLSGLKALDLSGTGITALAGEAAEQVVAALDTFTAKNLALDSIAALAAVATSDGFDAAGKTWDLSGSSMADSHGQIAPIAAAFDAAGETATFNPPTVLVADVQVAPANTTGTYGDEIDLAATIAPADADIAGIVWSSSDETVATVDGNGHVTFVGAGQATITCTVSGPAVVAIQANEASATCAIVVNVAPSYLTEAPSANDLAYTGEPQALVSGGSAVGGTIVYFDEATGQFTTSVPQGTMAGTYTVTYKVLGDANHADSAEQTLIASIARATDPDLDVTANKLSYTGEAQPLVTATQPVEGTLYFSTDGGATWTTDVPVATEVGRYTVLYKVEGSSNHASDEVQELQVVIAKAASSLDEEPAAVAGLTYSGAAQNLVSAGIAANDGTVVYSLDGIVYGTTIPTATMPGTYHVYYKVAENGSYSETAAQSIEVVLDRAAATVTANAASKAEGDDDPELTVTVAGLVGSDTASSLRYTVSRESGEAQGTYAISVSGSALQGGYSVTYEGATFTITEKKADPSDGGNGGNSGDNSGDNSDNGNSGNGGNSNNNSGSNNNNSSNNNGNAGNNNSNSSSNNASSNNGGTTRNAVNVTNNYYTTNTGSTSTGASAGTTAASPAPQAAPAASNDNDADDADDATADDEPEATVGEQRRDTAGTQSITEPAVPLSSGVQIEDDANALSSGIAAATVSNWSLFDLIATFGLGILAVMMLVERALRKGERAGRTVRVVLPIAGAVLGVAGVVALFLTQDFSLAMGTFDAYSLAYGIALAAQAAATAAVFALGRNADDDAEQASALA